MQYINLGRSNANDRDSYFNRDFERLSRRLHQLQSDSKVMSTGSLGVLHREFRAITLEAKNLEQQLSDDVSAREQGTRTTITRKELLRRTDHLQIFMADLRKVEETILTGRVSDPPRENTEVRTVIPEGNPEDMKEEIKITKLMQEKAMESQDNALDALESDVGNLKNIGMDINAEIRLHNEILEEVTEEVDTVRERVDQTHSQLREVMRKQTTKCLTTIIIVLIISEVLIFFLL